MADTSKHTAANGPTLPDMGRPVKGSRPYTRSTAR